MEDCGNGDEGEEGGGELVTAGGDPALTLEHVEEVLHAVAFAIETAVKRPALHSLSAHGKTGKDSELPKHRPQRIGVAALAVDESAAPSALQALEEFRGSGGIGQAAAAQAQLESGSFAIHQRVGLGGEATPAPSPAPAGFRQGWSRSVAGGCRWNR